MSGANSYLGTLNPCIMTNLRKASQSPVRILVMAFAVVFLASLAMACGDDDDGPTASPSPDASSSVTPTLAPGTPAPADPALARRVFGDFVAAVQDGDMEQAWGMYIASVPGDLEQYNATLGCSYIAFADEFGRMQHMLERVAPLTIDDVFGAATASLSIELTLTGADGNSYLATLQREPPDAAYRITAFNNGRPAAVPGAPDPFPSPEDPQGYCAIWTGPR